MRTEWVEPFESTVPRHLTASCSGAARPAGGSRKHNAYTCRGVIPKLRIFLSPVRHRSTGRGRRHPPPNHLRWHSIGFLSVLRRRKNAPAKKSRGFVRSRLLSLLASATSGRWGVWSVSGDALKDVQYVRSPSQQQLEVCDETTSAYYHSSGRKGRFSVETLSLHPCLQICRVLSPCNLFYPVAAVLYLHPCC